MSESNRFFRQLGLSKFARKDVEDLASKVNIPVLKLKYYNKFNIIPDISDLGKIEMALSINRYQIMIGMGIYNQDLQRLLERNLSSIMPLLVQKDITIKEAKDKVSPDFDTSYGKLFRADCLTVMKTLDDESIDLIFADPPFNLNKNYLSEINDALSESEYLSWCEKWLDEGIRILKTGGCFYMWNMPKWNTYISDYLNKRLFFKHWIATDIKYSLPISGKLYPSHYSLLYYTKGEKPNVFHPDRLPMEVCKNCFKELKDYGGYKDKMNPKGISLTDVWYDISPVRHKKYKGREEANELPIKLMDRIIEISTNPGDVVFDPFGGSGTTYIVAEIKNRKWIGTELGPIEGIINRFDKINDESKYLNILRNDYNILFSDNVKRQRRKRGMWTDETFKEGNKQIILFKQ